MTEALPPDVSVILPAYNVARFIERAVASALAQKGTSVEVIVADDASRDATAEIAAGLAAADPRVRLLRAERNGGAGAARNRAIAAARGRWLAVLDADDAFPPGRLARLVALAEAEGLEVIADLPRFFDLTAGRPAPGQPPGDGRLERLDVRALFASAANPGAGVDLGLLKPVFARRLAEAGLWRYPEGVRHGEDFLLYVDLLAAGTRFGLLHETGYLFSTRIGALSGAWSQGSVTPVDYRAVMADTRRLIDRIAAAPPPGLDPAEAHALLIRRLARIAALNRAYGWNTLRKGAWGRHWAWLRGDPRNAAVLAGAALGKVAGKLGLRRG